MDYTNPFTEGIVLLASLGFLVAVYYTYRLSQETKGEKYWSYFLIAALLFGFHYWAELPLVLGLISKATQTLLVEFAAILGALSLAHASRGLYRTLRRIRQRVE